MTAATQSAETQTAETQASGSGLDIGGFLRGRFGLGRTTLVLWLLLAAYLVLQTGALTGLHDLDTDDAMRLVQTRDWLAGQGWFDTTQHRGMPAPGFSMHWSRLGDLGPAGLITLFGLAAPAGAAETAAMTVWPLLLLLPALAIVGHIARSLAGPRASAAAMILFGLMGPAMWQFKPGRIDHHNLQIIGLLAMLAAVLKLRSARWAGAAAGVAGAFTLAVGLEALPFWLTLCGLVGVILTVDGARARGPVISFGLTTALATPALALAFNPSRYVLTSVCDQVALPVLGLAVIGGLGLAACAFGERALKSPWARFAAVGVAGAAAMAAFMLLGPNCLSGPYANVDPRLQQFWLGRVQEARPLIPLLLHLDGFALNLAAILALGAAGLALLFALRPTTRWPAAIAGVVFLAAFGLVFLQLRVISYAAALACPLMAAGLVTVLRVVRLPRAHFGAAVLAGVCLIIGAPIGVGAMGLWIGRLQPGRVLAQPGPPTASACYDPRTYSGLSTLAPGVAAAPIDNGPFILMASPLSVLSAPYHRNTAGLLAAHELLAAPWDRAQARAAGVDYVLLCPTSEISQLPADSLGRRLSKGEVPAWLTPVATPKGGDVKVYRVD